MTFKEEILEFKGRTRRKLDNIYRDSMKDLVEQAQKPQAAGGNMPVETGFLRSSIRASLTSMPTPVRGAVSEEGFRYNYIKGRIDAIIDKAKFGIDTVYIGWTAAYARRQENQFGFMRLASQNWRQIVSRNSGKLKDK